MYRIEGLIEDINKTEGVLSIPRKLLEENITGYEIELKQLSKYNGICISTRIKSYIFHLKLKT